jgi:hypothetical protein
MAKTDLRNLDFGHLKSKLAEVTVPPTNEPTEASTARQRRGRGISVARFTSAATSIRSFTGS